jgi:tetratricopeptide (TPR) repeat protein
VHVEARLLMRTGQNIVAQPLPSLDARDAGDAAKQIERALTDASKAIPAYKTCTNDLRAAKYPDAIKDARTGLVAYPNSTFARLCLLTAFSSQKAPADSIIAVANAIVVSDPTSMIALTNLAEAYAQKGDTADAIKTNLKIYRLDPSNTQIASSIVAQLAQSGAPDQALPIIDSLLVQNPGDPTMMRTKWLLLLRANKFKQAIAAGEEWVKVDTSGANSDYYQRQIGAAQKDSNTAMIVQLASKASQKFPKEASFPLLCAQGYRKIGQLQQALQCAQRGAQIEPKNTTAWLFAITIANDLKMTDTARAIALKAIASGANKDTIGTTLLLPVGTAIKKAQESKARGDWEAALKLAQNVDSIVPLPMSKYFVGVSSFQIGVAIMDEVQRLARTADKKKEDRVAACTLAKQAEDMFAVTSVTMPAGGSYDKETAGKILGAVQTYTDYIGQVKKAFCK